MPGVEELVLGPIMGVVFQQLHDAIKLAMGMARAKKFNAVLTQLQTTVILVTPKIEEISRMDQERDNYPKQEITIFLEQLKKAKKLVTTCTEIPWWNIIKKHRHAKRLEEVDSSLRRLLNVEIQAEQLLSIKQVLSEMDKINRKLDRMNFQKKSSSVNENYNKPKPGVTTTEGDTANPGVEQSNDQGKRSWFRMHFRKNKQQGETVFDIISGFFCFR